MSFDSVLMQQVILLSVHQVVVPNSLLHFGTVSNRSHTPVPEVKEAKEDPQILCDWCVDNVL